MLSRKATLSPVERMARCVDPTLLFADADLPPPHAEQAKVLRNWRQDHALLWSRQAGKSTTGAVLACHNLLFNPSPTLTPTIPIVSRAERQSGELFRKARWVYGRLAYAPPLKTDSATTIEVPSGGRILAYPGDEQSVRGLSAVTLALIDEATLVEQSLRDAISPMLSTTGGPIWSMASARGQSGWFYEQWSDVTNSDFLVKSKLIWRDVPHLLPAFIDKERRRMPRWQFEQEYMAEFIDEGETQIITREEIRAAINPQEVALW